jgi:integrase
MERFGVTKKDLGVTPHGLRHQYAADKYRDSTGSPPPVNGGGAVEPELDIATRRNIAERLGHGRVQITNAYLVPDRKLLFSGAPIILAD